MRPPTTTTTTTTQLQSASACVDANEMPLSPSPVLASADGLTSCDVSALRTTPSAIEHETDKSEFELNAELAHISLDLSEYLMDYLEGRIPFDETLEEYFIGLWSQPQDTGEYLAKDHSDFWETYMRELEQELDACYDPHRPICEFQPPTAEEIAAWDALLDPLPCSSQAGKNDDGGDGAQLEDDDSGELRGN